MRSTKNELENALPSVFALHAILPPPESDAEAGMAMDRVVAWELELYGSHGMQAHRYDAMLAMVESGVRAIAMEAGKAVVFDREEMIQLAKGYQFLPRP